MALLLFLLSGLSHTASARPRPLPTEALRNALLENDAKPVRVFLNAGGNPNARIEGDTLLTVAANDGSLACLRLLLSHGARLNLPCADGDTPLMRATRHLYRTEIDTVRFLVAHGADVNQAMPKGTTPLMMACSPVSARYEADYAEAVALFLRHGARVNTRNRMGYTALKAAQERGAQHIIVLLKRAGAKAK